MLVAFGTRVVDKNGKGVGTVSRVVLHSGSRQASGLVVHQGVLDRRQIVVPITEPREPSIAAEEEVFDKAGQKVGEVDGAELDLVSGRIVRIIVRRGSLFRGETAIPASLIAKAGGRITLSASADEVKKLERA